MMGKFRIEKNAIRIWSEKFRIEYSKTNILKGVRKKVYVPSGALAPYGVLVHVIHVH